MQIDVLVFYGLIGAHVVLVVLIIWSLFSGARADPIQHRAGWMIRPSRSILWCAIIMTIWAACGAAILIHALITGKEVGTALIAGVPLLIIAALLAVTTFLRYFRNRITWDADGVTETRWNTATKHFAWDSLQRVVTIRPAQRLLPPPAIPYKVNLHEIELQFSDGQTIRATLNMTGYGGFARDMIEIAEERGILRAV